MKFNDVSFPHPVLGVEDAVRGNIGLNPDTEITSGIDSYSIIVHCSHDNDDLAKLVTEGQAEYFCEVTCSNTLFRKCYISGHSEIEFEIPKKQVKGKVRFICTLVAKNALSNYKNAKSHGDYDTFSFDLDVGDILAFFGEFSFNADINYERLRAVSSFMEVVENKDPAAVFTSVDLTKVKIEIQLPSVDYKAFAGDMISKELKFAAIFHSSIVLNALLMGLYNYEEHRDLLWAKVIDYRLKNEEQFETLSIDEKQDIPEIAQRLLGNPFSRLISGLSEIIESDGKAEDF